MDKAKGWAVGMAGEWGGVGEKWRQLYLNNNKEKEGKKRSFVPEMT